MGTCCGSVSSFSTGKMDPILRVILTSIAIAASATWAVKLLNFLWFTPRKLEKFLRKQGLNGSPYRPFLGDVTDMIKVMKAEQPRSIELSDDILPHILPYYHQRFTKYGPNSFFWFGPWPRLFIADPELIKEILRKPDIYQKPLPETGKILTGGILFLEGQKWASHRKIINPAFHLEKLKVVWKESYVAQFVRGLETPEGHPIVSLKKNPMDGRMAEANLPWRKTAIMVPAIGLSCSSMIHKWEAIVSSSNEGWGEIDVWPYLEDLTGDVISRTAFGSSHEEGRRIFQLQRDKLKLTLQILQLSFIPGWRYLPTRVNRKLKAITNETQSLIRGIIDKREKAEERGEAIPSDDLLGVLMESNSRLIQDHGNKNAGMSIEDVIEECKLFYLAGSETTSSLLVWTMVLLCKHPEWQTQAREEVNQVFGNSKPSFEGLNHLKTVTMILQEVLRLYSPVPLIVRGPTETVKLGNLTIPVGVHLTLLIGLLHYDPEIWGEDAKEFKPQRFSEGVSNAAKIQSSFIPFSSGPRVCVGQNFAMIEAKMALAMILQRFSFELSPSYLHAPFSVLTTLQPQYGAPLILRSLESLSGS